VRPGWGADAVGSRRRVPALVAVLVLAAAATVAILLTRSSGNGAESPSPAAPPVLPLLGTRGQVPEHAALGVKLDNTERGRPQTGLAQADVVFEEMVEGGLTRLLAVYQSQDPDTIGPVRSARSTDLFILAELGRPLFAWSGANPTFAAAVEAADLLDVGAGAVPDAYHRAPDRPAPYNLYAAPAQLRAAVAGDDGASVPPEPLFTYRDEGAPLSGPGVEPATTFRSTGAGGLSTSIAWNWDAGSGTWLRSQDGTPHVDRDDRRLGVPNVIVRFTPYRDSGVRDSVGAVVPEADAVGEGDAWLLSGGQMQRGRWSKPSADAPTTYVDSDGSPLRLAPGQTWVEVLPPGSGEVG
jgi:Protein of unknown function (DUF3048) N-terminal domain/Protein of unknown function (DUF3048) C-terminal domain